MAFLRHCSDSGLHGTVPVPLSRREDPQIQFTWMKEKRFIISGGAKSCEILALAEADSRGLMAFSIHTALIFCSFSVIL